MASKAELALILSLVDDVSKTAKEVKGDLEGIGKQAQGTQGFVEGLGKVGFAVLKAGAVVAAAAITTAVTAMVAIGKAAWDAATQVDEAMDTIIITTGATGEELAGLEQSFKTVLSGFPATAAEVSEAIASINQTLEMTGPDLERLATGILTLSKLTKTDVKTNVTNFSRVMGDWGIKNEYAQVTLDQLFTTTQLTGIGIEDLMTKVVQFGSPLRLMGFSLEESMVMFGKFAKEGVNAELVMGSMRIAAGKFAKAGQPLKESLMGIFETIKTTTDASAALALGMEVFGAKAGPDMVAAIREGRFSIEELTSALDDSTDALEFTLAATADWPEVMQIVKNKITLALEPIGTKFLDLAKMVLEKFLPVFEDKIVPFFNDNVMPVFAALADAIAILLTGDYAGAIDALLPDDVLERWKNISPIFGGLAEIIKTGLRGLAGASVWEDTTVFDIDGSTIIPGLKTQFIELGGNILKWIAEGLTNVGAFVTLLLNAFSEWAESGDTKDGAKGLGISIGTTVGTGIRSIFDDPKQVDSMATSMEGMLSKALVRAIKASLSIGFQVTEGLAEGPLQAWIESYQQKILDNRNAFLEWGAVMGEGITDGLHNAWQSILLWFLNAYDDVVGWLGEIAALITSSYETIKAAILKPFDDAAASLNLLYPETITNANAWINGIGATITDAAGAVYDAITQPFVNAWNWIRANIPGMGGTPIEMPQIPTIPQVPTIPVIPPVANTPPATTPSPGYTPPVSIGPGGDMRLNGAQTVNNFTMNINTSAPAENIISDFSIMSAMAGA